MIWNRLKGLISKVRFIFKLISSMDITNSNITLRVNNSSIQFMENGDLVLSANRYLIMNYDKGFFNCGDEFIDRLDEGTIHIEGVIDQCTVQ